MRVVQRVAARVPSRIARRVPFILVAVLAQAMAALPPGPRLLGVYQVSCGILGAVVLLLLFPSRGNAFVRDLVPSLGYLVSVGFLLVAGGTNPNVPSTVGGLSPLVLLPVISIALYGRRIDSAVICAGVLGNVAIVALISDVSMANLTRKLVLWGAISILISVTTHTVRDKLAAEVRDKAEMARQSDLMNAATRRLTSLLAPGEVVAEATKLMADITFPSSVESRRAVYLEVKDGVVKQQVLFDETDAVPTDCLLRHHPYVQQVIDTGEPVSCAIDTTLIGPTLRHIVEKTGITHAVWIPLASEGKLHGIIKVASRGVPITDEHLERCRAVGDLTQMALANALAHEALERLATTDPLTGLVNRRGLALALEGRQARRRYAVMVMDLDDLKATNDTFGHAAGDNLLCAVAAATSGVLRTGDVMARLGGDEFSIFLADTAEAESDLVAHRILDAVARINLNGMEASVSIGIACGSADDLGTTDTTRRADVAMYEAKTLGGGRALHYTGALTTA